MFLGYFAAALSFYLKGCYYSRYMMACTFSHRHNRSHAVRTALVLFLCVLASAALHGQDAQPGIFFPEIREAGAADFSVGIRVLTVPRDIAEEEINRAPSLDLHAVLGLPLNFNVSGRIVSQYVTNYARGGVSWSHAFGRFRLAVGNDAAYWFGFFDFEGFDNRMSGWVEYPNISVGYDAGDVRLTTTGEFIYLISQSSFAGDNEISLKKSTVAGGALTMVIEQPLWHKTQVYLGVRLTWTNFHYQTWFAFSTFDRRLLFSELLFGVIL